MKTQIMFNYDYLFGDYMGKCSHKAKLYYVKLMFFADNGFVSNPLEILDSLGFDKEVLDELIATGELLKLPDRAEVFITSYFIHNHFKPMSWLSSPFSVYWKGKLYIKKNGVATFTPQQSDDPVVEEKPVEDHSKKDELNKAAKSVGRDWDAIVDDLEK